MNVMVETFEEALLGIDRVGARRTIEASLKSLSPIQVVEQLITPALEHIGESWELGTVALSQVYMSGRICEELVNSLLPPGDPDRKIQPKIAVAVLEDYHLLGKRIVVSLLRANGYELLDFGTVDVDELVSRALADSIEVLLISALMLPSALHVKEVVSRLKDDQKGAGIKIVVGGAPFRFDEHLYKEVGADAMGKTASDAVEIIARLTGD